MKYTPIELFSDSEYDYPMAFGFRPDLTPYIHEEEKTRPCVIVVPGGGYALASPTEGELVAERFYDAGFQTFVLTYTTNLLCAAPLMDLPMRELARAVRLIRVGAGKFKIDPNRVVLCGFSAGAHLCGSVCVHFDDAREDDPAYNSISARPNAAILSYPVITSGDHAHQDSFRHLLGGDIYERRDPEAAKLLDHWSLEKHVTENTPPIFLWQTVTDELVPVENSLLMAASLREHNVPHALHLFSKGRHGLSLADERWAEGRFGDDHCARHLGLLVAAAKSGELALSEDMKNGLFALANLGEPAPEEPNREVSAWPDLALSWLETTLKEGE